MLKPHPLVLRNLLERYESLAARSDATAVDIGRRRELEDVTYTLCVSTGTRDVQSAVAAARGMLEAAFAASAAPGEVRSPSSVATA